MMTSENEEELSTNILMDATVDNIEESPLGVERDNTSSSDTCVKEGPVGVEEGLEDIPDLLDDVDSDEESWGNRARYGTVGVKISPDNIMLKVEYDEKDSNLEMLEDKKQTGKLVEIKTPVVSVPEIRKNVGQLRKKNSPLLRATHLQTIVEEKQLTTTVRDNLDDDVSDNEDSTKGDQLQVGILGSKRTGRVVTVAASTPILSESITSSVPLIHSVVIYPRGNGKKAVRVNSMRYDRGNEELEKMRAAFPEPNPTVFDNSIYVDVAMQAMSVDDIDKNYPLMTPAMYAEVKRSYQIDGGASLTAISEAKAKELRCKLIQRREFQITVAVANGETMSSRHYTPLKLTFKGVNDEGKPIMKTVMIIANVVPSLSGGVIIGSDVMKALRITIPYNDENTATLKVLGDRLTFKYNTTEQQREPAIKRVYVVSKSERAPVDVTESFNALFYGDRYHDGRGRAMEGKPVRPIPWLLKKRIMEEYDLAASDPKGYLQKFRVHGIMDAAKLVALHRVISEYDVEVREGRTLLRRDGTTVQAEIKVMQATGTNERRMIMEEESATVIGRDLQILLSPSMPDRVRAEVIKKYIEYQITQVEDYQPNREDECDVSLHKVSVVDGEVITETEIEMDHSSVDQIELEQTMEYIKKMRASYCTSSMDELRPEEFPEELWKYVFDSQKVLVHDRWKVFKEKCSPPERLQEVIQQIMKIDISVENSSRIAEEPYFRAQCMANLHIYAHPDPRDPPSVKGREYEINLSDTSPCTAAMRKTSLLEKAYLYWRTKQLESRKMIGISSSAYNNPPLCVPYPAAIAAFIKKHGDNAAEAIWKEENANEIVKLYRLVNDFRDLNNKTKLERWPLPYILDLIDKMRGSGRYSTEDIEDAFFTVPMKKDHRQYTAFSTPHGHFEYLCMGQGLKNAANFFARIVHEMFYGLQIEGRSMSVYQDDVCNYSDDLIEHLQLQQEIYDIMATNTLVFKSVKGHLNYTTQRILGHIMSKEGRAPDPSLVRTINNLAKPTTLEAVRSCLGLAQVAREYVHNLAEVIAPIQQLARKGVDIEKAWGTAQDDSFAKLKEVITTAPVLVLPNVMKKFRVHVDACRVGRGIGAILLQLDEHILMTEKREVWRPVAYWSRALTKEERRYSATELECTALHDAILHWRVYLQNGLQFDVIVDHYALVYMVTKMSGTEGNLRLHNLCLGLQGYTFSVTHRKGELHMDADAVSRLFHKDEVAYVHNEEDLRDDMHPLTDKEKLMLINKWGSEDSQIIREIIERHKQEQNEMNVENITKGSAVSIDDELLMHEVEDVETLVVHEDDVRYDQEHVQSIHRLAVDSSKNIEIPIEYTFCFYCDAGGVLPNMYLEGGKEVNSNSKMELPYLLKHNNECLVCLSIHTWVYGAPTYVVDNGHEKPFEPSLSMEEKSTHLESAHRWIQRIMNIRMLDKINNVLILFPIVTYSVYHQISELLGVNNIGNHVLRLIISTQYSKLPKIVIDTMEYEFIVRRLAGRGYSKYFQQMSWEELIRIALDDDRLVSIIPDYSRMFEDHDYIRNLLDMFIRVEIQQRQELVFLREGVMPLKYSNELASERIQLNEFLRGVRKDDLARLETADEMTEKRKHEGKSSDRAVEVLINALQGKSDHDYVVNLNNIRRSMRIREKNEIRKEKELEELREKELRMREDKSKKRTKRYNKKIRRKLKRSDSVVMSEMRNDDVIAVRKGTKSRRKPKMIIVDKRQQRPPPRLVGEEYRKNRERELVHETLESFDYLVQELIVDPEDGSTCMVMNTYMEKDKYMATLAPIDCEAQHEFQSENFKQRQLLGENGVVNLVEEFHRMATGNSLWPKTNAQWLEAQKNDQYWCSILDRITEKNRCIIFKNGADYVDYVGREDLEDGSLGPLVRHTSTVKQMAHSNRVMRYVEEFRQMIVPDNQIMMCMEITHKALGHPGCHRMIQTVRKSYFWKSMMADIRLYCSNCHYCRARKSGAERGSIPILGYYISERPWQRCHIDCIVGLPISDIGQYTAVLILKCALSKFVCLEPLKEVTAQEISEALMNIFTNHGVPEYIISDNGVEFANCLTNDVVKLLGANKFHITPLNPRANGQAENQVKTVKDMLSMLVSKDQRDWSLYIRLVQMRYNSTVNQATGFSPYFMMNGREMPTPAHDHIQSTYDSIKNVEVEGYFGNLILAMMLIWEAVGEEILSKTEHYNKTIGIDVASDMKSYEEGQYVFMRQIPRRFYKDSKENVKYHINFKLQPIRWTGPYRILEKVSPVLYVLDFHNVKRKIHIIHLKLASNTSIHRRRLELIRKKKQNKDKEDMNGLDDSHILGEDNINDDEREASQDN